MIYTSFVFKNNKGRIQGITSVLADEIQAFRHLFDGEKATLFVAWIHAGGKASGKQRSATASCWYLMIVYPHVHYDLVEDKFVERDLRGFMQRLKHSSGHFP